MEDGIVTVYVSDGFITCVDVPLGHKPIHVVDTSEGTDAWFEEGHTEEADTFLHGEGDE